MGVIGERLKSALSLVTITSIRSRTVQAICTLSSKSRPGRRRADWITARSIVRVSKRWITISIAILALAGPRRTAARWPLLRGRTLGARRPQEDRLSAEVVQVGQCGRQHSTFQLARVARIPHGLGLTEPWLTREEQIYHHIGIYERIERHWSGILHAALIKPCLDLLV